MPRTRLPAAAITDTEPLRREIEADIKAYLDGGGTITKVPRGLSGDNNNAGMRKQITLNKKSTDAYKNRSGWNRRTPPPKS